MADYQIETRGSDGVWRPGEVVNKAGLDYRIPQLIEALGAENVTYRPAIDGVDFIVTDDE